MITLNAAPTAWASDATYASGPQIGGNTKTNPGAGRFAQGFVPGDTLPAQHLNFHLAAVTTCLAELVAELPVAVDGVNGGSYALGSNLTFTSTGLVRFTGAQVLNGGTLTIGQGTSGTLALAAGSTMTTAAGALVRIDDPQDLTINNATSNFLLTLTPQSQSFDNVTLEPTWLPLFSAAGWVQHDVGSARQICFPITLPPGDDILTLTVRVNGAGAGGGHSSLPAGGDRLTVSLVSVAFDGVVTTLATRADQSANVGAYDISHVITLSSGSLDSGSLPQTINDTERYFVVIAGEHGANAEADTTVITEIKGTCTARSYRAATVVL